MIDQRIRGFQKSALAGRKLRTQEAFRRRACDGNDANQRKPLVIGKMWIAYPHKNHCAASKIHATSSTHPSPGIQWTGVPALLSTSTCVFDGQTTRPLVKSLFRQFGGFRMWIVQRMLKLIVAAPVEVATHLPAPDTIIPPPRRLQSSDTVALANVPVILNGTSFTSFFFLKNGVISLAITDLKPVVESDSLPFVSSTPWRFTW